MTNSVNLELIVDLLGAHSVPNEMIKSATELIPDDCIGLLVYGSYARGDFIENSDLDLLALTPWSAGSVASGGVSLSRYTLDQLRSAQGTLFGMHLQRDGLVVFDTDTLLQTLIDEMRPIQPSEVSARIRQLAAVLEVTPEERRTYVLGLTRVARYLLRTAIYVEAVRIGQPCFSVRELALRFQDPELVGLLASDRIEYPSQPGELKTIENRLSDSVGELGRNPFGSLRSLLVSEWFEDPDRSSLAVLALSSDGDTFDYSAISKVLL